MLEWGAAKDLTDGQWYEFLRVACTKAGAIAESNYPVLIKYKMLPRARLTDLFWDIFAHWAVKDPPFRCNFRFRGYAVPSACFQDSL